MAVEGDKEVKCQVLVNVQKKIVGKRLKSDKYTAVLNSVVWQGLSDKDDIRAKG